MSFCVAGVALPDILTRVCKRVESHFVAQAQYFCVVFRRWGAFFRGRRSTWDVSCCVYFARIALSRLLEVVTTRKFHGRCGMLCDMRWRSALRTPHSTLYTPHFTFYNLPSTLYTPHTGLNTPHFTLYTPHFTFHTPHSTLHIPQFTLYTPHSTLYTPHFTPCTLHSTLCTPHSTLHTPQFTLYTPHFTLHTPHSTLYTPPSFAFHSLQRTGTVTRENVQDCSNILFHKSVLCDCILVRGLHLAMFHGSFDSMCTVDVEYGHLGNPMMSFINGCVWTTNLRNPKDILKLDMNMFWNYIYMYIHYIHIYIYNQLAWDDWVMTGKCFEVYWGYFLLDIVAILNIQ